MSLFYRFFYLPGINALLRPFAKLFYQLSGRELMSVSGKIRFKVDAQSFDLCTNQTCYVTKNMFYHGLNAYEFNWIFSDLAKNARCFLDVGANIGLYSVMAAKLNPMLEVHAFEPGKGAVFYLRKNIQVNQLTNVRIHELAVSDQDASLEFHEATHPKFPWLRHNLNGSSSLQSTHGRIKTSSYQVEVCRLSTFLSQQDVEAFDLMKLDTEHNEHFILRDSSAVIGANRPIIMIEIYPEIAIESQGIIQEWPDYRFFQVSYPKLKEIPLSEVGMNAEHANYLLVPTEKTNWIEKYS